MSIGSTASVGGRTAATAATAGHAIFTVWNPHTTKRISLVEIALFKTAAGTAGDALELRRTTARGTAGSTITPAIAQDNNRDLAPASGFLLDLAAFSVQPTLEAGSLRRWTAAAAVAAGIVLPMPRGLVIPPAAGIAICQIAATIWPVSDVYVEIEDA